MLMIYIKDHCGKGDFKMAVRFRKGIDWDYYGVDILKYDYLPVSKYQSQRRDNFIDTNKLKEELQKEGEDKNAFRRKFMGLE